MLSDAVDDIEAFTEKWFPALYPGLVAAFLAVSFSFLVYAGSSITINDGIDLALFSFGILYVFILNEKIRHSRKAYMLGYQFMEPIDLEPFSDNELETEKYRQEIIRKLDDMDPVRIYATHHSVVIINRVARQQREKLRKKFGEN